MLSSPAQALIYIHGFLSSPLTGKGQILQRTFPGITLATYDTLHPDIGFAQLDAIVRAALPLRPILIGSSLGGFWAYHFASRYALKCVLLNPCMHPAATLGPYVGLVENLYTDEQGRMNRSDLLQYDKYRPVGEVECVVLHEKGDELIPYQESVANFTDKARLILIEGGSHRFENLELAIGEIRSLVGNQEQG